MPIEERALIFERFARGATAGRRAGSEGAGLGLALVDEHVRMHGGRVWVDDRTRRRARASFVIELPPPTEPTAADDDARDRAATPRRRCWPLVAGRAASRRSGPAASSPTRAPRDIPVDQRGQLEPADAGAGESSGASRVFMLADGGDDGQRLLRSVLRDVAARRRPTCCRRCSTAPTSRRSTTGCARRCRPTSSCCRRGAVAGTLNVDLSPEILELQSSALRFAVAQIVFTADELEGVRAVRLRVDGEIQAWPAGRGELQTEPLTVYDFPGAVTPTSAQPPPHPAVPTDRLRAVAVNRQSLTRRRSRPRRGTASCRRAGSARRSAPAAPARCRPRVAPPSAPTPGVDEVDRRDAEPRRQHAVERRRGPAALDVAEHHHPRLEPGALPELAGDDVGHAAEADVAELVVDLLGRRRASPAPARRPRRRR